MDTSSSDFKVEKTTSQAKITGVHESLLQECEKDIIWYRDNFFGKSHTNLLAAESPNGPLAVSIIKDDQHYKVLVRSTTGSDRLMVKSDSVQAPLLRKVLGLGPAPRDIVTAAAPSLPVDYLKVCKDPLLPNELLSMEERQVIRSYKFGLLYLKDGQSTEEEMYNNSWETASPALKNFMSFLGEKIELKNWKGYRAGLDVNENQTGTHSYYTKWQGYEVMFHVSLLLPMKSSDKQQLERKRHIGNDIVVIIFQDGSGADQSGPPSVPVKMSTITSKQNHVFAVVRPKGEGYAFEIANKSGVVPYQPEIPEPAYFDKNATSRDYFLHKLVNAERASYKAPGFAPKISRTRSVLLYDVAERFLLK
ncbi:hypothetical protein MIR68_000971 [Amoeboaphelidium protococcarum]|nr:hypothetical protein MIR68_000971 [Amoeboaphelidium protococcarum]